MQGNKFPTSPRAIRASELRHVRASLFEASAVVSVPLLSMAGEYQEPNSLESRRNPITATRSSQEGFVWLFGCSRTALGVLPACPSNEEGTDKPSRVGAERQRSCVLRLPFLVNNKLARITSNLVDLQIQTNNSKKWSSSRQWSSSPAFELSYLQCSRRRFSSWLAPCPMRGVGSNELSSKYKPDNRSASFHAFSGFVTV